MRCGLWKQLHFHRPSTYGSARRRSLVFFVFSTTTATTLLLDHRIVVPVRAGTGSDNNNNKIHGNHQHRHHHCSCCPRPWNRNSVTPTGRWYHRHSSSTTTTGPAARLIHPLLGNKLNFAACARSLGPQLDQPRRTIGLDLRNYGACFFMRCVSFVS